MFIDIIFESETIIKKIYKKEFSSYKLFEREIYWFQKFELYNFFPSIIDIDYLKNIIYFEIKIDDNLSNNKQIKDFKKQIDEVLEILKINNCQLNNLQSNDIIILKNRFFIINMLWCIDLTLDVSQEPNYWPIDNYSSHINRNNFLTNKFIINNILNDNIDKQIHETMYLIYIYDYKYFLKIKNKITYLLNKSNIILINDINNIDKIKNILSKLKKNRNYEIRISEYQNILEDIELFKYIIDKFKIKYLGNIFIDSNYESSIFSNLNTFEKSSDLIKQKNKGIIIKKKDIIKNGIFGNLEYTLEIKDFCLNKQIDFKNYISDINNFIDWEKYQILNNLDHLKSENDLKIHWISEGLDRKIYLPLKKDEDLRNIPIKLVGNNFIINIEIFNNLLNDLIINNKNKKALSQFLMYSLNYFKKETIIIDD